MTCWVLKSSGVHSPRNRLIDEKLEGGQVGCAGKTTTNCTTRIQIANCICLKFKNVFLSNGKVYFFQIAKCVCLKYQNVKPQRTVYEYEVAVAAI